MGHNVLLYHFYYTCKQSESHQNKVSIISYLVISMDSSYRGARPLSQDRVATPGSVRYSSTWLFRWEVSAVVYGSQQVDFKSPSSYLILEESPLPTFFFAWNKSVIITSKTPLPLFFLLWGLPLLLQVFHVCSRWREGIPSPSGERAMVSSCWPFFQVKTNLGWHDVSLRTSPTRSTLSRAGKEVKFMDL